MNLIKIAKIVFYINQLDFFNYNSGWKLKFGILQTTQRVQLLIQRYQMGISVMASAFSLFQMDIAVRKIISDLSSGKISLRFLKKRHLQNN